MKELTVLNAVHSHALIFEFVFLRKNMSVFQALLKQIQKYRLNISMRHLEPIQIFKKNPKLEKWKLMCFCYSQRITTTKINNNYLVLYEQAKNVKSNIQIFFNLNDKKPSSLSYHNTLVILVRNYAARLSVKTLLKTDKPLVAIQCLECPPNTHLIAVTAFCPKLKTKRDPGLSFSFLIYTI